MGSYQAPFSPVIKKDSLRESLYLLLAERVGFEPTVRLHAHLISNQAHSATLSPLRERGIIEKLEAKRDKYFARINLARIAPSPSGKRLTTHP